MNHICDHLGEALDSPKCIAIKNHLNECGSCQKYFSSVENTVKFYKLYDVKLPSEAHNRLMDFLGLKEE